MNEEEKQELETLRAEKLRREQVERARAALERGGVPQSFASLLAGGDDGDTDRRTEEFRAAYQASLAEGVKSRLPASAPVVTEYFAAFPSRNALRYNGAPEVKGLKETIALCALKRTEKPLLGQ